MVVLSVIFLKFMLSAMSVVPSGVEVIPWTIFVVAIAKTGRKIDALIMRIGLNPAATGDPLGGISRMPGMLTYIVARNMVQNIGKSAAAGASHNGQSGSMRPGGTGTAPTSPARPGPVSGGGTVHSSAEFAAETTSSSMQANPQTSGGGNTASRGQPASRPPVGRDRRATDTVPQNMGNSARNHSDISMTTPAESAQSRNPAQPAAQSGGRNTVSTEARRASAPSAARPTAQTRTAQTVGMMQNAGQSGSGRNVYSNGTAGGKPAGVENRGTPYSGRNTADSTLLRTNPADIRSSAPASQTAHSTNRTENTAHNESVSVRQNQTTGRPPMQNGTPRPNSAGGDRQARPSIHSGGALRQNGTTEGRQSRPDVLRQEEQRQEISQIQRREETLHNQARIQTSPIFGGARTTAGKMAGDASRPVSGRETMRGAAVQKAVWDSVPDTMKPDYQGRNKPISGGETAKIGHKPPPYSKPTEQRHGATGGKTVPAARQDRR